MPIKSQFSELFVPGKIGKMQLRNRIVMPAMGNNYASREGYVTKPIIESYSERAKGGVALIIPQAFNVSLVSGLPNRASLHEDGAIGPLSEFATSIHEHGGKLCAQLLRRSGAMLATAVKGIPGADKHPIFVPTALPSLGYSADAKPANPDQIAQLVEDYAQAALRAKKAGCDAIEVHGNNGIICVISTFMSSWLNRRTDAYGGNAEKRARLACEVVVRIRQLVGPEFPIIFRMSGNEGVEGGTTPEEAAIQAQAVTEAGADAISVSSGMEPWTIWVNISPYMIPRGISLSCTAIVKRAVKVPVIAAGRLNPDLAAEALRNGVSDFVAIGRPLFADPFLVHKVQEGRFNDINECLYCNNCMEAVPRRSCTVNPSLFREKEFAITPVTSPKRVMVIGGGVAGMEAAAVLAQRGHEVSLHESSDQLGGQWCFAAMQENKSHYRGFIKYLSSQMKGVNVRLNDTVGMEKVQAAKPDVVVVATGATPVKLDVTGGDGPNVCQALDVLAGKAKVGQRVAVVGGSGVGMELALSLSRQNKTVAIISTGLLGEEGFHLEHTICNELISELIERNIPVYDYSKVAEVKEHSVVFSYHDKLTFMPVDTVVLALGFSPNSTLAKELRASIKDIPIHEMGDCKKARHAHAATHEAAEMARQI